MATQDGPRYVVCLQKLDDLCCSTYEFETEKLAEAKSKADQMFEQHGKKRMVHIIDRENGLSDPYRLKPLEDAKIDEPEEKPTKKKRKATQRTVKRKK